MWTVHIFIHTRTSICGTIQIFINTRICTCICDKNMYVTEETRSVSTALTAGLYRIFGCCTINTHSYIRIYTRIYTQSIHIRTYEYIRIYTHVSAQSNLFQINWFWGGLAVGAQHFEQCVYSWIHVHIHVWTMYIFIHTRTLICDQYVYSYMYVTKETLCIPSDLRARLYRYSSTYQCTFNIHTCSHINVHKQTHMYVHNKQTLSKSTDFGVDEQLVHRLLSNVYIHENTCICICQQCTYTQCIYSWKHVHMHLSTMYIFIHTPRQTLSTSTAFGLGV